MHRRVNHCLLAGALFLAAALDLPAQGTSIFYQGRLTESGTPANTNFDFRFGVFNAPTNGAQAGVWVTNLAVPVSNGLFSVTLDFGPGVFNGTANGSNDWLDVAVCAEGNTSFTELAPRQPILPAPYALFATSASNLLGTLPAAYSNSISYVNGNNTFVGTFSGNGAALTNLNASSLAAGTLADALLQSDVALLDANQTFTSTNTYNSPVTFKAGVTFNGSNTFTGPNSFAAANSFSGTNTFTNNGNIFVGTFRGNGAALTNLDASSIAAGTLADARLQSDVALLDTNQTYTGTNTYNSPVTFKANDTFNGSNTFTGPNSFAAANSFSGTNTFTNNGNYFIGSFFGNGLVGWLPVYGTSTNAMRDAGYLMLNAGFSTLTLPATASLLLGDIVRVSGGGGGGWQVQENSSQSILGNFASYRDCIFGELAEGPTSNGHGVAASADGVQMYAVGGDLIGVYASSDSGRTWSQISGTQLSGYWSYVACSANGRIVYAEPTAGTIQKSSNGGITWSSTGQTATGNFISCTADGSALITGSVACSGNGTYRARLSGGAIQFSANGGASWTTISTAPANAFCLAASSDCTRLVAGVSNGLFYASSNLGATWTTLTTTNQFWSSAWMSPDGARFAATVIQSGQTPGGIFSCAVSALPNTANTNSTIVGSQGSAVELQYLGNGQFTPVSSTGLLWAN